MIRMGFWGPLYYNDNKEPQNSNYKGPYITEPICDPEALTRRSSFSRWRISRRSVEGESVCINMTVCWCEACAARRL